MPPIENLQRVPERALQRLERQGIFTTGLFLEVSETPTRRIYLADQVGVSINEINDWRDEALLLNLANFGKDQQRALTQAGIIGLSDLLDLAPSEFQERVVKAAYTLGMETPSDLTIQGWYEQAQTLAEH
jgi:hypothetical protein